MALWNGLTLNKTVAASTFNQLWDGAATPIIRKDNGLLYLLLDKKWAPTPPREGIKIDGFKKVSGDKIEWRLRGRNESLSTVADGAAENATATGKYSDDTFGAAQAPLTHYANTYFVPDSEYDRIQGDESKTKSFIADKGQAIIEDHENEWGNQINGTQVGFTRTSMGSWLHAVSDGVSAGETTYATYAQVDRSDAANIDFRGVNSVAVGALTLDKLLAMRNRIRVNGGRVRLLLAETTIYSALESVLMNKNTIITYDEKWSEFGGEYWKFAGMIGVMEHRMPTQTLGLLDPEVWRFWMDAKQVFDKDKMLIVDPSRVATRVIIPKAWTQLLCKKPNSNGKMTGITSVA